MTSLIERARREGTPLIDGDQVTFVWEGDDPPLLVGDFTGWGAQPIKLEQREHGVWATTITFPSDAYLEYAFVYDFREDEDDKDVEERALDPYNSRVVWNGMHSMNQTFHMPDFKESPLNRRGAGVKRGKVSEHDIRGGMTLGAGYRQLFLYHPPVDEPVPLVVVWDGTDYLRRANLNIIVDNLIAQKRIRPIALAMIENAGGGRFPEYFQNDSTIAFLIRQLLPFANKHLNLIDEKEQPGCHGVLGASMGGLMALYTAIRAPEIFGQVVSQSGAFFFNEDMEHMLISYLIEHLPVTPIKIWQDVGKLEYLLTGNRKMHTLLNERGYDVTYHEYGGGHNYAMWSQTVGMGLEAVFGEGKKD